MKKIFVDIYLAYNLGDDLFLDILSKKYKNVEFTVNYVGSDYDYFIEKYANLKRRKYTYIDKFLQKLKVKDTLTNYKQIAENHDAMIFIGGSIFRDENYHEDLYNNRISMLNEFKKRDKPVFVLGSNFGPYKRESFLKDYREFFSQCEDVCFRDKYSYNLFKDIKSVRYEPDIVFQLNLDKFKKNEKKNTIGFSIIDVNHKEGLAQYEKEYINSTIKSIELFVSKGYRCCLMSFCEREGDLKCINLIMSKLGNNIKDKVEVYEYKGNLEEAINIISEFRLFLAARFHANIIALLVNVPILPVIYSSKTTNMLNDIGLNSLIIKMDKLEKMYDYNVIINAFDNVKDIKDICIRANNQFEKLTKFIQT